MCRYILLFFILFCCSLLCSCKPEKEVAEIVIRPIKSFRVQRDNGIRARTFSGASRSFTESKLSFRVSGMIEDLTVKLGEKVAKNQLLAKIDDTDYRLQVEDVEAKFHAAETDLGRMRQLYENNTISTQQLDQAIAQRDSIYAKLGLLKKQLSYAQLRSPINGYIAELNAEVHETVGAGQTIMMIDAEGDLEIGVSVPDSLIGFIKKGNTARIVFVNFKELVFEATVVEVARTADVITKTYPVTLKLERQDDRIKPGMTCDVIFSLQEEKRGEKLLVPSTAILENREGNNFVWIVDENTSKVHKRQVSVGNLTTNGIEVISGITDGEIVASAGVNYLEEGQEVKLLEEAQRK
ncbi:efflux RND transporter periplasmic adaptor subunit [Chlamydiota bacterium]